MHAAYDLICLESEDVDQSDLVLTIVERGVQLSG